MFAPAKTPATLIRRLNEETVRVLTSPDVQETLLTSGVEVIASAAEGLVKQMKSDTVVLGKVIRAAKIRVD
jgi:tripartite-type tricarboxylate transporter receptor subunit TctC